jgi:uncharacterized protein YnzC (UPF0291/DUF896 family)
MLSLIRQNTFCNIRVLNGKALYQAFPLGRVQRNETVFLKVEQCDISFVNNNTIADNLCSPSFTVHGPRKGNFNNTVDYLIIMEMVLNRFEHDGLMTKPFRPAKSNLSRTKYEIMMGVLSHYHKKLVDNSFYWKVDRIRVNRIDQIIEETDLEFKTVGIASSFKVPVVGKERLCRRIKLDADEVEKKVDKLVELANEMKERDMMRCEDLNALDLFPGFEVKKRKEITWAPEVQPSDERRISEWLVEKYAWITRKERDALHKRLRSTYYKEIQSLYKRVLEGTSQVDDDGYEIFEEGHLHTFTPVRLHALETVEKEECRGKPLDILKINLKPHVHEIKDTLYNPHPRGVVVKNTHRITKEELGKQARDKWQMSADLKMNELLNSGYHCNTLVIADSRSFDPIRKSIASSLYNRAGGKNSLVRTEGYFKVIQSDFKTHKQKVRKSKANLYKWEKRITKSNCTFLEENVALRLIAYCMTIFGVGVGIMCQNHENMRYWVIQKCAHIKNVTSMGTPPKKRTTRNDMKLFSVLINRFL